MPKLSDVLREGKPVESRTVFPQFEPRKTNIVGPAVEGAVRPFLNMLPGPLGSGQPSFGESIPPGDIAKVAGDPGNQRLALEVAGASASIPFAGGSGFAPVLMRALAAAAGAGGASLLSETFDPTEEPLKNAAKVGGLAATGETLFGMMFRAAKGGTRLVPGGREAFEEIASKGELITPGLVSRSSAVDIPENLMESSIFGRGIFLKVREGAEDVAVSAADDFTNQLSRLGTRENVGEVIQEILDDGAAAHRLEVTGMFNQVDELAEGVRVDLTAVKAEAEEILKRSESGLGSSTIRTIINRIRSKPNSVTFKEAQVLRSDLLSVSRQSTDLLPNKTIGAAKQLAGVTDNSMVAGNGQLTDKAAAAFRAANNLDKKGHKFFNSQLVKTLIRSEPEVVYNSAIKAQRPGTIRRIRSRVADEGIWSGVQAQFMRDLLANSSESGSGGRVLGKNMSNHIRRFGTDALDELFSPVARGRIQQIARTIEITQAAPAADKTGGMLIQLAQGGAVIRLVAAPFIGISGPAAAASTAIVFGPLAMANMFTNKTFAKWLTIGLRAPPGSELAVRAFGRVSAIAAMGAPAPRGRPEGSRNVENQPSVSLNQLQQEGAK